MVRLAFLLVVIFVVNGTTSPVMNTTEAIIYVTDNPVDVSEKKSIGTKTVEGCFKSNTPGEWMWKATGTLYDFGNSNSNHKCQEKCRMTGKILAATQGPICYCGNTFPSKRKVSDSQCRTPCASYSKCYSPQECCGGKKHYSVSVVGDIDVAREILERLRSKWHENADYRKHVRESLGVTGVIGEMQKADWVKSMDKKGWSDCPEDEHDKPLYLHGLYRNAVTDSDFDGLGLIEYGDCRASSFGSGEEQECEEANWLLSFDKEGWSNCADDYFISGLYRSGDDNDRYSQELFRLEKARCCRQPAVKWGECIEHDVTTAFDNKGWTRCPEGFYMAGLYRSKCNKLYCIEKFRCCKMESKLVFTVIVKDLKEKYTRKCTMTEDGTFTDEQVSGTPKIELKTEKFEVEDKSELSVAAPQPIAGFKPKICSASNEPYECQATFSIATTKSSTFSVGTGFSMSYTATATASVGYEAFGASVSSSFESSWSASASFNAGYESSDSTTLTDTINAKVSVPKGKEVTIDVKRVKNDLVYFWKGHFSAFGAYSVGQAGHEMEEDVTRILAGCDRKFFSFGKWEYPDTDFHKVIITDKYGVEQEKDCKNLKDTDEKCTVSL